MAKQELSKINRNTAMTLAGVVQITIASLLSSEVPDGSYLFGFDAADPANEDMVMLTDQESTREPLQHVAEPFLMKTWVAKKIILQNPQGEGSSPAVRLVLIDPEGDTLAFVSGGVVMSMDVIRTLRGDGPYNPPIPIIVVPQKTRKSFTMFKLRIHKPELAKAPAK